MRIYFLSSSRKETYSSSSYRGSATRGSFAPSSRSLIMAPKNPLLLSASEELDRRAAKSSSSASTKRASSSSAAAASSVTPSPSARQSLSSTQKASPPTSDAKPFKRNIRAPCRNAPSSISNTGASSSQADGDQSDRAALRKKQGFGEGDLERLELQIRQELERRKSWLNKDIDEMK